MRMIASLLTVLLGSLAAATAGRSPTRPPAEVLERARNVLGGLAAFRAVQNIVAEGELRWTTSPDPTVSHFGFTLVRPDCFQWRTEHVVHSLKGDLFWQNIENPDALRQVARGNTEINFVIWSLVFLLDAPSSIPLTMSSVQDVRIGDRRGYGVQVRRGIGLDVTLVVDVATGRPLGLTQVTAITTSSGSTSGRTTSVWRFRDYKRVAGVMLPFTVERQLGDWRSRTTFTSLRVNVPDARSAFDAKR